MRRDPTRPPHSPFAPSESPQSALERAVGHPVDPDLLLAALAAGADPRQRTPGHKSQFSLWTPLMWAVQDRTDEDRRAAGILIPLSDVNASDPLGFTALMSCATHGSASTCAALLAAGANPLACDIEGRTALMRAMLEGGNPDNARLLLPVSDALAVDRAGLDALAHARKEDIDDAPGGAGLAQEILSAQERQALLGLVGTPPSTRKAPRV